MELYQSKGTEQGIKLLFQILFGSEPRIVIPNENILRASDGIWTTNTYMFVEYLGNDVADLEGFQIFG